MALQERRVMDSALYTKPYEETDYGAFFLPNHVSWRVLPRYVGEGEDGLTIVDERITVVLQDEPNHFWPVIVKMSIEEAEQFKRQLAKIIKAKKRGDDDGGAAAAASG
jgi:hypothetical protein